MNREELGWSTVGSGEISPADSTDPIAVEADATGLEPNSDYAVRLVALPFDLSGIAGGLGVSADARHVSFNALAAYVPVIKQLREEVPPKQSSFTSNVYQWDEGVLSLAGILPDGTVPPGGSFLPREGVGEDTTFKGPCRQTAVASSSLPPPRPAPKTVSCTSGSTTSGRSGSPNRRARTQASRPT